MVRKNLIAGIISAALLAGASVLAAGQAGAASETCQISRATCEYFGLPYKPHPTPSPSPGANPCAPKRPAPTAKPAKSRVTVPRNVPSGGATTPTTGTRVGGQGAVTKSSPGPGPMYIPPPSDSQRFGSEDPEADRAIQSLGDLIRLRDADLDKPVPFLRDPGPEVPRSTASIDQISVPSPTIAPPCEGLACTVEDALGLPKLSDVDKWASSRPDRLEQDLAVTLRRYQFDIDLRHFVASQNLTEHFINQGWSPLVAVTLTNAVGLGFETSQLLGWAAGSLASGNKAQARDLLHSAFDRQDFYSNFLGSVAGLEAKR